MGEEEEDLRTTQQNQGDLIRDSGLLERLRGVVVCGVGSVDGFDGEDAKGDGGCEGGGLENRVDYELADGRREDCCRGCGEVGLELGGLSGEAMKGRRIFDGFGFDGFNPERFVFDRIGHGAAVFYCAWLHCRRRLVDVALSMSHRYVGDVLYVFLYQRRLPKLSNRV